MGDITVQQFDSSQRVAWDAFVRTTKGASIYHETWWMDVVSRCFRHENMSLLARDDKGHVRAVLPLFRVTGFTSPRLVSVPLRDQAGILGDAAGTRALLREIVAMTRRGRCAYLTLKQGAALQDESTVQENGLVTLSHWVTHEVALPLAVTSIRPAARRNVRKAERHGLRVEVGTDQSLATRFYRLFRETRKRLGVPTYPREFFLALAAFPEHVTFILCSNGEQDLAGAVILFSNRKAAYAYAANSLALRHLRAADLVVWTALNWATERGLCIFDFGADSPVQEELIRFKNKWGAQPRILQYYYYLHKARAVPARDHAGQEWQWIRRSISFLPDVVFDTFSDWIVQRVD